MLRTQGRDAKRAYSHERGDFGPGIHRKGGDREQLCVGDGFSVVYVFERGGSRLVECRMSSNLVRRKDVVERRMWRRRTRTPRPPEAEYLHVRETNRRRPSSGRGTPNSGM